MTIFIDARLILKLISGISLYMNPRKFVPFASANYVFWLLFINYSNNYSIVSIAFVLSFH